MRTRILLTVGLLAGLILIASIEPVFGDLSNGSVHRHGSDNATGLTCAACHRPQGKEETASSGQRYLWNPTLKTGPFEMYTSPTLDASVGTLSGSSVVCMSCHDGSIASTKSSLNIARGGLANDHPVSIRYDSPLTLRDRALYNPTSTPSGLGGSIATDLLEDGMLQCTSCHVFHERNPAIPNLLRKSNSRSALCLTYHDM